MTTPKTLCLIAVGGRNKRIPRQPIRPFLGTPVIAYSIRAAQETGLFDTIMVSTDDAEVATMAQMYGASVPFPRGAGASQEPLSPATILNDVLATYAQYGYHFDRVCFLHAVAPFVTARRIQEAFAQLDTGNFDTVLPVVRFSFPVQRAVIFQHDRLAWLEPEHALTRSQDLPPTYHDAGQFYCLDVARFRQTGQILTDRSGGLEISELETQVIDDLADWELAELKVRLLYQQQAES